MMIKTTMILGGALLAGFASALLNPSFEDGTGFDATSWPKFGNAFRETVPGVSRTGSFAMKMFGNFSGGANDTGVFQDFAISVGQSASVTGYGANFGFDAMKAGNTAFIKLIYRDAANNDLVSAESSKITKDTVLDTYQLLTASLGAAPVGTDHGSVFLLFSQPATAPQEGGAAWFDDISVQVVPEPSSLLALGAAAVLIARRRRG